jgi:hypothetical protein
VSRFGGSTTRSLSAAVLWEFVAVLKPFAVLVIDALDDPHDLTATLSAAHSDRSLPLRGLRRVPAGRLEECLRIGARRREWARFRRHLVRPLAQGEADHLTKVDQRHDADDPAVGLILKRVLSRAGCRQRIQPSTCGPSSSAQVPSSNRQTAMSASTGPEHSKQGSAAPRYSTV